MALAIVLTIAPGPASAQVANELTPPADPGASSEVWTALNQVIESLEVSPKIKTMLKKGLRTIQKHDRPGHRPAAFSITLSMEGAIGFGVQFGYDLVFFPHRQMPGEWEAGFYKFHGYSIGGDAHVVQGLGVSVIYHMNHMDEYAGPYCAVSASGTKIFGLDASAQIGCDKEDLKVPLGNLLKLAAFHPRELIAKTANMFSSRMLAVALTATAGAGAGASVAITDYTEIGRHTLQREQISKFASEWLKSRGRLSLE